jgi:hypothetical protein
MYTGGYNGDEVERVRTDDILNTLYIFSAFSPWAENPLLAGVCLSVRLSVCLSTQLLL